MLPDASDWAKQELYLRLLLDGEVRVRAIWSEELDALCRVGWAERVDRSGRRIAPRAGALASIEARLERWKAGLLQEARTIREAGADPFDRDAYRIARRGRAPQIPARVSRKVASAVLGRHSKAALAPDVLERHGVTDLLGDGCIRIRCATTLRAHLPFGALDLGAIAAVAGEVSLPERILDEIQDLEGSPSLVLTVENPGAFLEMPLPEGAIAVLAPGTDTAAAERLISRMPLESRVVHFGDFDPRGLEASERMGRAAGARPFAWLIPDFIYDYAATHWLTLSDGTWPERARMHSNLRRLVEDGCWMEQEAMVLDPRLAAAIEKATAAAEVRAPAVACAAPLVVAYLPLVADGDLEWAPGSRQGTI